MLSTGSHFVAKSPPNQVLLAYGVFITAAWAVYHFVANGEHLGEKE